MKIHWFAQTLRMMAIATFAMSVGCCNTPPARQTDISAQPVVYDLPYKTGSGLTDYEQTRCKLDLYCPNTHAFPTVVWFYGGALTGGDKSNSVTVGIARAFARNGIACAAVNYRLSPKAKFPAYLDDAAAATAWVLHHIADYGGDPRHVFVGGHSAGGYLSADIGFDVEYLQKYGVQTGQLAGLLPVSPQVFTHFTIRRERGIANPEMTPVIDESAPAYHIRPDAPPTLVLIGDHDWGGRLEECQYFVKMAQLIKDKDIDLKVIKNRTHASIAEQLALTGDEGMTDLLVFIAGHEAIAK